MRISSFLSWLQDLKKNQRFFFLFGANETLIGIRAWYIKFLLEELHQTSLITRTIHRLDKMGTAGSISLFNTSQSGNIVYSYHSPSAKSYQDFQGLNLDLSDGYLIWQGEKAAIKSPLVQGMDKHSLVSSIPTYQVEKGEIAFYIKTALNREQISYPEEVLEYLTVFHQEELSMLLSNLDVLKLFGLKDKKLSLEDVRQLCQTLETEDLKTCAYAFMQGDQKAFVKKFKSLQPLSQHLIPFLRFTGKMLQNSLEGENNPYQRSLGVSLSKARIIQAIQQFHAIERQIKTGQPQPESLVEKTLYNLCSP